MPELTHSQKPIFDEIQRLKRNPRMNERLLKYLARRLMDAGDRDCEMWPDKNTEESESTKRQRQ